METAIDIFLLVFQVYFLLGLLFAIYFVTVGVSKIDEAVSNSKKRVRLILFPGIVATWPFLLGKLFRKK